MAGMMAVRVVDMEISDHGVDEPCNGFNRESSLRLTAPGEAGSARTVSERSRSSRACSRVSIRWREHDRSWAASLPSEG